MDLKSLKDKLAAIKIADIIETVKGFERKTWILICVGVIATVLFFVFMFVPGWCKRPALHRQSQDLENQLSGLKTMSIKKPQLEKQKKEIEEFIELFQKRLFNEAETPFLLGKISKVAQESEVELVASNPIDKIDAFPTPYDAKYKKSIYQLTAEGSYHRIADFISRLESYSQYFQIQSLDINPKAEKNGKQVADIINAVALNSSIIDDGCEGICAGIGKCCLNKMDKE